MTIAVGTELRLKDYLGTLWNEKSSWRAVGCKLSLLSHTPPLKDLEKIVTSLVANHLAGHEGAVFLFPDKDAVVLCKAATKKILDELILDLASFFADPAIHDQTLCHLYDLSVEWTAVYDLCNAKIEILAEREARQTVPAHARSYGCLPPSITEVTAKHIPFRRAQRGSTVVMLVEDDPLSLRLAQRTVGTGYICVAATDGATARDTYVLNAPTIVFLDIGLPDVSGHQVLSDLQAIDPQAFIVMLSANSYPQDIMKAMQLGAKGFICKPFSIAKLKHYIEQAEVHHLQQSACLKV